MAETRKPQAPEAPAQAKKPAAPESVPEKRERVPLGVLRTRLDARIEEGKAGRWVADREDRVQRALDAGYEFVRKNEQVKASDENESLGDRIVRRGGSGEDGRRYDLYLMQIDKRLYDEDQHAKESKIDEAEREILDGTINEQDGDMRHKTSTPIQVRTSAGRVTTKQ